jgi:hypothetical protein
MIASISASAARRPRDDLAGHGVSPGMRRPGLSARERPLFHFFPRAGRFQGALTSLGRVERLLPGILGRDVQQFEDRRE